jgi:hypothetical protein
MIWRGYLLFVAIALAVLIIISACAGALWLVDATPTVLPASSFCCTASLVPAASNHGRYVCLML